MRTLLACVAAFLALALPLSAEQPASRQPPLTPTSTAGSDLFKLYCSSCHGIDAKGRVASSAGKAASPDLTTLAGRNGGLYPRERVRAIIVHGVSGPTAHGTDAMPVWGTIFGGLEVNEKLVEIRIANLVQYLESLQEHTHGGR